MNKTFWGKYEKVLGIIIAINSILVCISMILSNEFLKSSKDEFGEVYEFNYGWTDERGNSIAVPSDIAGATELVSIYNQVPQLEHSASICIRSSQQDIIIKIGGEIRQTYSTKDTRIFGKNSASRYVFAQVDPVDSGKDIEISFETTSMYKGRVNSIFIGNSTSIVLAEFDKYIRSDISALFLLFIGAIALLFGIILFLAYKEETPIAELGCVAISTGIWRLCESRMRQFYFNNNSAMAVLAFVMLALMPLYMLRFVDRVFKRRYERLFSILETVSYSVFLLEALLQVLGKYDFVESLNLTIVECSVFLLIIIGLLIYEVYKRRTAEYRLTAIGIAILVLCAFLEIAFVNTILKDRIMIFIGVFILFFLTAVQEVRTLIEKTSMEHIKQQEHAEALSLQVVTALSATVDTKDRYTNGHSNRVAEYAREIARRYGMSDEELVEIYYAGLLHDIGKIGVADQIINKTERLDDSEFAEIRKHPSAGSDILKNVTEMPNLQIGARWHHERYDGKGYPDGLCGEAIPVQARIIAVADSYDAMTSYRSYRDAMPQEKVYSEIERCMGSQFDPVFAAIMLKMIKEDKNYSMREVRS